MKEIPADTSDGTAVVCLPHESMHFITTKSLVNWSIWLYRSFLALGWFLFVATQAPHPVFGVCSLPCPFVARVNTVGDSHSYMSYRRLQPGWGIRFTPFLARFYINISVHIHMSTRLYISCHDTLDGAVLLDLLFNFSPVSRASRPRHC